MPRETIGTSYRLPTVDTSSVGIWNRDELSRSRWRPAGSEYIGLAHARGGKQ
jgi:hypothetical protein